MRQTKQKRLKALPVMGAVGASLSLAGGASVAGTVASTPDQPLRDTAPGQQITLSEEEISDVSLGTFFVFNKENVRHKRIETTTP